MRAVERTWLKMPSTAPNLDLSKALSLGSEVVFKMSHNRTQMICPHEDLSEPVPSSTSTKMIVNGTYEYWHYGCDGLDDRGWGCGYRTLQTIASWIRFQRNLPDDPRVPSLPEIQNILVTMEDKSPTFRGSREWIGSFEVCLVLDHLYDIPSKIIHVNQGSQLKSHFPTIQEHFRRFGSPIMMGGDQDCSSKGIFGALASSTSQYLLIVDPHYWGKSCSNADLFENNWIHWRKLEDFVDSSFYNMCLPQIKAVQS
ncbi:hypothetical protein TCAL_05407 [Tigriopus californicus]|uniref:UFSP1/2/DUB catalytic domain-containing protein n=2 Tax=Tigriopus californicus TaxID=6832 RepID=A0A553P1I5_TIGCA|nr:hypothetical protein TCAL_05407 [Tigriopus californicus]